MVYMVNNTRAELVLLRLTSKTKIYLFLKTYSGKKSKKENISLWSDDLPGPLKDDRELNRKMTFLKNHSSFFLFNFSFNS